MFRKGSTIRLILSYMLSISLLVLCILGSLKAFFYFYNYTSDIVARDALKEKNPNITEITLEVSETTTMKDLADYLYEKQFISNPFSFRIEGKLKKLEDELRPGSYSISSNMSNDEILKLITSDVSAKEETVKFTIPEGYTITQIADKLDSLEIVTKESFIDAVNNRTYNYPFLKDISDQSRYKLEGYLFPDTYIIRKGATPEEIIIKMLNRFEEVTSKYANYIDTSAYSLNQILSIASIIEQEAKLSEERPVISGVIYNRLNADMKLQMCSTIQYVLEKRKAALSYSDLEINSPYNTYKNPGLPIGPICCPGEESISAALMPEENDYYFFVVKDEEAGSHSFSKTAKEHERNKTKYQQSIDKNFYE